MTTPREQQITDAFVALSNSLVDSFDVVDLLSRLTADCTRLLAVASAGLLLADGTGVLHVLAASSEQTRSLELFQLQRAEGPCLDCYRTGSAVFAEDLREYEPRWPQFVAAARSAGFASVHALPMRLRDRVLGTLGLFGTKAGALGSDDVALGQALAHVATVALVAGQAAADSDAVTAQLRSALASRVRIEQAKGLLAQAGGLDMEEAFARLRHYARDHNEPLSAVARAVITRTLSVDLLLAKPTPESARRDQPPSAG